jgi:hypothetical protein
LLCFALERKEGVVIRLLLAEDDEDFEQLGRRIRSFLARCAVLLSR